MKPLATIILMMGFLQSLAQHSPLRTSNPIPRQGEEIELTFSLKKEDLSALEKKNKKTEEEHEKIGNNRIGNGSFKISEVASDTGIATLGPFSFTFGERTYHTGVATVRVYPKLPSNIRQGFWMRYVEINGQNYLITEQRIDSQPKYEKTATGGSVSFGEDKQAYAALNKNKLEEVGLKIISSGFNTSRDIVDKLGDEVFSGSVNYRRCIYTLEKQTTFKGPFELTKKLFDNYPEQVYTEDIVIK